MAKKNLWWAVRNFGNWIDTPFDNFKHWLNGEHKMKWGTFKFEWKMQLPDWLMSGRDDPTK